MYEQRLRRNLRRVIEEHGVVIPQNVRTLDSIGARHLWNIEHGKSTITVNKLEAIADEIGADFLEFFRE